MVKGMILRTLQGMLTVLILVLLIFVLIRSLPGDPAVAFAGEQATAKELQRIREIMGLDEPIAVQVIRYLQSLATGDLGRSVRSYEPVRDEIANRVGRTAVLAFSSIGLALVTGVALATLAATRPGSLVDGLIAVLAVVGYSTPLFWIALVLIDVFAVRMGALPTGGYGTWRHLLLPMSVLVFYLMGPIALLTRGSLAEVIDQDYIRTARAKGLAPRQILVKHALRNAILPTLAYLGTQAGLLLGGTAIVETVFNWHGLGMLVVTAALSRDYPLLQGCVLVIGIAFVSINSTLEFLYEVLDPRIGHAG